MVCLYPMEYVYRIFLYSVALARVRDIGNL